MQDERVTVVKSPVGDSLIFTSLSGQDEINRCFAFTIAFVSEDTAVDPLALLGKPISVEAEHAEPHRWFSGLVTEFRLTRIEERLAHYEAVVRPWLWFAGLTRDCRIFQNLSTVQIAEEIFGKYAPGKVKAKLQGTYKPREYCVQYDETDLDFVQRLLEHEGIVYWFEHEEGDHTLVLSDSLETHPTLAGGGVVPFHMEGEAPRRDREYIDAWVPSSAVRSGAFAHTDFDFTKPTANLMARSAQPFAHALSGLEQYAHPGAHLDVGRGDALAAIRREELQAEHRRVRASGTVRGLYAGCKFTLDGFPREDQNAEHVVVRANYRFVDPAHRSGAESEPDTYRVNLEVAPAALPLRPPRLTPRPVMRGPQTATVVGPAGAEIYTDKYGRVKVQFHWDRLGKRDQNSSCYIRVSQTWAGAGWGFIQIPRIGQEVVVDFLEGDPDRPLITGRVYNGKEMPPYGLPGNATQSGLKTNSTPGGGGWNELRFEDKKGSEEVYFQAEKDHNLLIKHDRAKKVGHDQRDRIDHDAKHSVGHDLDEDVGQHKTTTVGVNRTVSIGSNDTETVGKNRSLTVGVDETISIGSNSTETIGMNHTQTVGLVQTITVGAARVDTVGAMETRTVGASRQVSVGISQSHSVGANDSWSVGANQTVEIGANQSVQIGSNATLTIGGGRTTSVGKDDATEVSGARALKIAKGSAVEIGEGGLIKVGKSLVIEAGDSIIIKCGSAAIAMKKDGTITIEGKDITVKASGKVGVKASGDITMKGSEIKQN